MGWVGRANGGPTSGRLRYVQSPVDSSTWVLKRSTTSLNILWEHLSDDTVTQAETGDFGGSGDDAYHSLSIYNDGSNDLLAVGGRQENGVNDSAFHAYLRTDQIPGTWAVYRVHADADGSALGFVYGVVTHNSRDRWVLTTSDSGLSADANWRGGTALPGTESNDIEAISSGDVRGHEGCVAYETTTPAAFACVVKTDGTVLVSRLVAAGQSAITTLPSDWVVGDAIEVGQCFCVETRFVAVVYNSTRDETFLGVVSSAPAWESTQIIPGEVVGGAGFLGRAVVVGVDATTYLSFGGSAFEDIGLPTPAAPLVLALRPEGTGLEAWCVDGIVYELLDDPAPTEDRARYRRMQRQSVAPTKVGFASDFATATASSTQAGFPVSRIQEWAYYGPDDPPSVGTFWQSEVDTVVDITFDMGSGVTIAPEIFMVCGDGSRGLDVLGFATSIAVYSGASTSAMEPQFELVLSPSTGNFYRIATELTAYRYWRYRIRGAAGAGGGPVGFFRVARAFFDTLDTFPTNFQATGLSEDEVKVTVNGREARKSLLSADWQAVGVTSGDFATWNDFRGGAAEQSAHLMPSMPLVFCPSGTEYLADERHLAPRVGWLRQTPPLQKRLDTPSPVFGSKIELVSI